MTRLQKKCLIAVAGTHLLLVVLLLCSGFIRPRPKVDNSQVLNVIPAKLIDAAFNSGVRAAQPPPPAVKPPDPQPPTPEPPKPEVKHSEPIKPPEPVKPPDAKSLEPVEPKPKPEPHKIEVNLKPVVRKATPVDHSAEDQKAAERAEKEAKARADAKAKAIQNAVRAIKEKTSSSMTIEMPADLKGDSTVAYANYGNVVISIYTEAWILPDTAASDDTNVRVSVTIANDGRVISAHIVQRAGDGPVDRSVQSTLDRVKEIAPFPEGSTDKERTYIINFNLKAKRQMLG